MAQPFQLCPDLGDLHSNERLNYVLGQVLGVKDFQQEQAYFLHKSQVQNSTLHGYGTVWGLAVSTESTEGKTTIKVSPGLAIDPKGREVMVEAVQCAELDEWLESAVSKTDDRKNIETLIEEEGQTAVYVTLCYKKCETGAQPIVGNPCRSDSGEGGVVQYTRIRDDFELQLRAEPPAQVEEDYVRAIATFFNQITVASSERLSDTDVAALIQKFEESLVTPDTTFEPITLPPDQAKEVIQALSRYWVTNIRPTIEQQEPCVLLAQLLFSKSDGDSEESRLVQIKNQQRPYLLQTRLLQELLLKGSQPNSTPKNAPTITIGNVTTGSSTEQASVVDSDPGPNVTLDFVIPRGQPGKSEGPATTGLKRTLFQPTDFLLAGEEERIQFATGEPATLSHINGYPALVFADGRGSALFSTLRPQGIEPGVLPRLYLYCASQMEIGLEWLVAWRWKKSIGSPPAGIDRPDGVLHSLADNSVDSFIRANLSFPPDTTLSDLQLWRSEPLVLEINERSAPLESDYLSAFLAPEVVKGETTMLYLLMAELVWGEGEQ